MTQTDSLNHGAPIVVIGMHRSGTTLVTRMLMELGVFMGARRDRYEESAFHRHVNKQLMLAAGATWASPDALVTAAAGDEYRRWAARMIRQWLDSAAYRSLYVGWWRTGSAIPTPHGFKDPRTTFTLPLWHAACGPARVVHVLRHGLDVARSLADRQRAEVSSGKGMQPPRRLVLRAPRLQLKDDVAFGVEDEGRGLALWDRYVTQARCLLAASVMPACEVRFEEVLSNPSRVLGELVDQLQLTGAEPASRVVRRLNIDAGRALAYRAHRADIDLETAGPLLARHGYEP